MIKSSISEYRVGDKVILKAEGDSATRTVIEVIDPRCQLQVGDSVNDFSNNMDYLNDIYRGGRFVIISSKQITSANSQEEFEDLIIDIEDKLGVNVEHSNIFNLPAELTYEDECYIDDICREQNCRFIPVNGSRRQYRLIQSSRGIQSMRTPKNIYLNEDTQKLIQRLEKRVGHELKLKFEDGDTPYVEIEKLPKGGYSFITDKYLNNLAEHFLYDGYKEKQDSFIVYLDPAIMYTRPGIKSAYTREDYDRFDEYGEYIPYKPTEEELAKKDEIKTVLKQELSDAYEPDPMDDYVGYDSTNERIDMACERVAKQFGVDTDFVEDIAGEIDKENVARQSAEPEYVYQHCKDKDRFWDWYNGEDVSLEELGIDKEQMDKEVNEIVHKYVNSSRQVKSALDTVKVTFDNGDTIVTDYNADVGREEIAKYYMHNYFNVGGEDELHQVVKVEFPGNINSARTPEVADMQDAEDLALFAENDHELYDMVIKPTFDNLQRKLKRGIYDKNKALIAWEHVIDEAAKAYDRQLGSKRGTMTMFNKATRKEAAKILMDSIWDEDEWQA